MDAESAQWYTLDEWWDQHENTRPAYRSPHVGTRSDETWAEALKAVTDPWWEAYNDATRAVIAELRRVIPRSNEAWEESGSRFDADPLTAKWGDHRFAGPIRPNQEENWSQWLAHLLRTSPELGGKLFGDSFDELPESVQREAYLPDRDRPDRYADILLFYGDKGVSIEVKKGDEHFGKTTHTAELVETHYDREWDHFLLVPERKRSSLGRNLGRQFEDPEVGRPRIVSDHVEDISVVYWREISKALRSILRDGSSSSGHWEASAYLFCSLVEQKILGFISQQSATKIAETDDVVTASNSLSIASGDVEDQITHLTEREYTHE